MNIKDRIKELAEFATTGEGSAERWRKALLDLVVAAAREVGGEEAATEAVNRWS